MRNGSILVRVDLDAGAKRSLEEVRVRGGDAVPPEGVQERREVAGRVEAPRAEVPPPFLLQNPAVQLVLPEHLEHLTLRVVVRAGQADDVRLAGSGRLGHVFHQPPSRAHEDQVADVGRVLRQELVCRRRGHKRVRLRSERVGRITYER